MIGQTISHYKILQKLGEGGMGEVYLAEDTQLDRKVALKFLPIHYTVDADVNARFRREAKAAAALNHPNIITVHEIGEHKGRAYIAMEYIKGQSLREMIEQKGLSIDQVFDIAVQICEGLKKAHRAGIVHRDLKPENIMLDAEGRAKILDFGLAQMQGVTKLTAESSTLGTIHYMSPEQCQSATVDHRTDIWAVGVILYEMITGKQPFEGDHDHAIMYSIVNEEPEPLAHYKTWVPAGLQRMVEKALDKDLETRYQHIDDLLTDLRREKRASSQTIQPVSMPKKQKRRAGWFGYAVPSLVAVLAVVIGISVLKKTSTPDIQPTHRQITFVGDATWPAISPDGQFIAYARGKPFDGRVIVEDLTGGQPIEVSGGISFYSELHWAPSGAELSFPGASDSSYGTYVVPRLGGSVRRISTALVTSWSPDGAYITKIAYSSKGIRITNTATDRLSTVISINGPFRWLVATEWSPLSNRLLCLTKGDGGDAIWTIKIDGSELQKVVEDSYDLFSPRWAANGKAIYYFRAVSRTKQLMKVEVSPKTGRAKTKPKILQDGLEAGETFTISRDNKRLFYTRELRYSNLWLVHAKDDYTAQSIPLRQLTTGTLANVDPSFSPDGDKIAFSVAKGTQANIFVMAVQGGQIQQLTYMSSYNASPVWSPDGREIAFASRDNEKTRVWKIHATSGTPRPFSNSKLSRDALSLTWAPGKDILYQRPGNRNFHRLDPRTEKEQPLVENESLGWMFSPRYSPDGKTVAIYRNMELDESLSGLWTLSLEDSSQEFLQKGRLYPIQWSDDGKWIYALDIETTPYRVLMVPAEGGETKAFYTLPVDQIDNEFSGITLTPDGKRLVYAAVESKSDVWVMEHFDPENELEAPIAMPDFPEYKQLTYLERGRDLILQKKYAEAEKVFREGLELSPKSVILLNRLGWSLNNQDRYDEAEEIFRRGVELHPKNVRLLSGLGWSLNYLKRYAEAEKVFDRGITLTPDDMAITNGIRLAALHNKHYQAARQHNERYLEKTSRPETKVSVLTQIGAIDLLLKDYTSANDQLRKALAIDSASARAYRTLGYLRAEQQRYTEAESYATKALTLDSSFANQNLMAWILVAGDLDLDRGLSIAEKAVGAKPEDWQQTADVYSYLAIPEHTLGLAYLKKGEHAKAVQYLEQAVRFLPERQRIKEDLLLARQRLKEMTKK
jgi:serine/threonine protein kinase/tetratricopeptide (TPR) repeat protein